LNSGCPGAEPGRAWLALAAALGGASLIAWWLPAALLDWQPTLALRQPWRAWTGAFVHWSDMHLAANLAGTAAVAALGWVARLPMRAALAWALAWPLTQAALLVQPALAHFGGLSGVLHAGVAVATAWLIVERRSSQRAIGGAVLIGLLAKVLLEEPGGPPLRHGGGWDIATAPLAHATGVLAGLSCALFALAARGLNCCARNPSSPRRHP
jgi:rhomboid family GlyGly-CTERM serine protease